MTPSERERRIEAGALAWRERSWPRRWSSDGIVALILDAADEAVPVVSEAEMQRRSRIDHEAAEREHERAERAEAVARDMAQAIRRWLSETGSGMHVNTALGRGRARQALARWLSFSGEEGTEG